jgi:short-subunit dehydrogenase
MPLNLLVNNAGLGDLGSFDSADWNRLLAMQELERHGSDSSARVCLLPMLSAQSPSGILNVSSIAGFYPIPEMAVYAATKAYVTCFSEALRIELAIKELP